VGGRWSSSTRVLLRRGRITGRRPRDSGRPEGPRCNSPGHRERSDRSPGAATQHEISSHPAGGVPPPSRWEEKAQEGAVAWKPGPHSAAPWAIAARPFGPPRGSGRSRRAHHGTPKSAEESSGSPCEEPSRAAREPGGGEDLVGELDPLDVEER